MVYMKNKQDLGLLVIRVAFGILFLIPGIYKIFVPSDSAFFLIAAGVIYPNFWVSILIFFEVLGGLSLITGYKMKLFTAPLVVILLVALVLVVVPGLASDKIGLISVLFHLVGAASLIGLHLTGPGKYIFIKPKK